MTVCTRTFHDEALQSSCKILNSSDLRPTKLSERTWTVWDLTSVWMGLAVRTFLIFIHVVGFCYKLFAWSWFSSQWFIFLSIYCNNIFRKLRRFVFRSCIINIVVLGAMYVASHPGTKWGVPYPVFVRSIFGIRGSKAPSLVRALIGRK